MREREKSVDLKEIYPPVFGLVLDFTERNEAFFSQLQPNLEQRGLFDYQAFRIAASLPQNGELLVDVRQTMKQIFEETSLKKEAFAERFDNLVRYYFLLNLIAGKFIAEVPETREVLQGRRDFYEPNLPSALVFEHLPDGRVSLYYRYRGASSLSFPGYRTISYILPEDSWVGIGYYRFAANIGLVPFEKI